MAKRLGSVFATEQDKVNCPFYHKVGVCRHGDRCNRLHHKPMYSQSIMIPHMWPCPPLNPDGSGNFMGDPKELEESFDDFYEDVYNEAAKFGKIEEMHVCRNVGDHIIGNVYIKYDGEEEAAKALQALLGRHFAGRCLMPEFSVVTDFKEARCRQYEEETCTRGGQCNFMHIMQPTKALIKELGLEHMDYHKERRPRGGRDYHDRRGGYDDRRPRYDDRRRDSDRDYRDRGRYDDRDYRDRGRYDDRDRDRDRDYRSRDRDRDRDYRDRDRDRDRDYRDRDRDRDYRDRGRDRSRSPARRGDGAPSGSGNNDFAFAPPPQAGAPPSE